MAQVDEHVVRLTGPGGASATIALFGATVVSFIPEDGEERLFKSKKSPLTGPKAIRGGIPVVWPAFGPPPKEPPFDKLVQHGFARTSVWTVKDSSNPAKVVLTLEPTAEIRRIYQPEFRLTFTVQLTAGDVLETTLEVKNPGTADLRFQALFHTYFRLPEGTSPSDVTISKQLHGLQYTDKVKGGAVETESQEPFTFPGRVDRVYENAPSSVSAKYGKSQQGIKIENKNLGDLVTWNPAAEVAATMSDLSDGDWEKFICLEPGHVTGFVSLPAGETWTGSQRITALSARLSLPANNAAL